MNKFFLLFALLGMCSCSSVKKSFYVIEPMGVSEACEVGGPLQVEVVGGSGKFLVYSDEPGKRAFYRTVKWAEPTSQMFEEVLLFKLDGFRQVDNLTGVVASDENLRIEIKDFLLVKAEENWVVKTKVRAFLINPATRRIERTKVFEEKTPVFEEDLSEIISSFNAAANTVLESVAGWVIEAEDSNC